MAVLWKLPVIFVVENNQWAIGMAHHRATSKPEIYRKAEVFGMPGVEVDGMDVLAVRGVAQKAIARARAGEGPTLIEALTYRFRGHSLADPDELRSIEEKEAWIAKDPILRLSSYIIDNSIDDQCGLDEIRNQVEQEVDEAINFALSSPEPDVKDLKKYLFSD